MKRKRVSRTETDQEWLFDGLMPDVSGDEAHRAHLLIATGLIITTMGALLLVTQLITTLAIPSLPPAPWIDLATDLAVMLVGGLIVWLVRSGHIRTAAWVTLGCILILATTQLYVGGHPPTDIVGASGLFLVVALGVVLLDRRGSWVALTVAAAVAFIGVHGLWLGGYLPPPIGRGQNRPGQALFSIIAWLTYTGIVSIVIGSTVRILRNQTEALKLRIAEQKLAEEQLSFQSMLLDQIHDKVTATDLDGQITYVNEAECQAFGKTADELIGQHVEQYGEDPERGATQQEIIETALAEGQWRGEVVNITEDGREIILDSRVKLIHDERGEPVGMLGISTDITERKEMEQQLRQQERLAAVGQLAAGIAHDFRNLLSTIILYAQLPMRNRDLPPDLTRNLQTIIDESYKATELIRQILDFSSRAMIKPRPLNLIELIEDVLDVLARTIPEHVHLSLDVQAADPERCVIQADAGRIQQALTNLALNARDAMPQGGDLRFTLSQMEVEPGQPPPLATMRPGCWVHLTVSDTGTGMTEEVQEHLFEPFFTTKEIGKGTGLGLAQVYGIVRQHEGHIEVETEPGKGTAFHIYLPAYEEETDEAEIGRPTTAPPGHGETILLVEDEEKLREAGREVLTSLGYRVLTAANGREALAVCQAPRWSGEQSRRIKLVITDIVMPEMGGEELMRELRRSKPNLRVMAITGYPLQEDDLQTLRDVGFVNVISKPLEVDTWAREIRRALDA